MDIGYIILLLSSHCKYKYIYKNKIAIFLLLGDRQVLQIKRRVHVNAVIVRTRRLHYLLICMAFKYTVRGL